MIQKTIREISDAWREDKRPYVKLSTLAAYMLILENHILPKFGESNELHENDVQGFVLEKLEGGLSVKSVSASDGLESAITNYNHSEQSRCISATFLF